MIGASGRKIDPQVALQHPPQLLSYLAERNIGVHEIAAVQATTLSCGLRRSKARRGWDCLPLDVKGVEIIFTGNAGSVPMTIRDSGRVLGKSGLKNTIFSRTTRRDKVGEN